MTVRAAMLTLLLVGSPALAAAQQSSGLPTPDKSLWPERPLSPPETELREAVIVLRDTLFSVEAVAVRLERGFGGSPAVLLATGRAFHLECARGTRASAQMRTYAAGLSTDNAKWGDLALGDFRKSVAALEGAMKRCDEASAQAITVAPVDAEALRLTQVSAMKAIRDYQLSVKGLLRTLQIPLDPRGSRVPVLN